jgi:pre-rRNA-processing protein TSR1
MSADPDRIILKKIVLTGYPLKCKKRGAIVKYMFFNPEDIMWFKPVELRTKHGMSGHIRQSVGLHGSMKAIFNEGLHAHDTVCMNLYKRVYPKHPGVSRGKQPRSSAAAVGGGLTLAASAAASEAGGF